MNKVYHMNNLFSISISTLLVVSSIPYSAIEQGFIENNASNIVLSSKDKLILNILGEEGVYSKTQSELILQNFFTKKPGNYFQFIFKGKETPEGTFAIGNYKSKSETFRVTLQFKPNSQDNYTLESLTIEKN